MTPGNSRSCARAVMKVQLSLISVAKDLDETLRDLAALDEKITGRRPTANELTSARKDFTKRVVQTD